MKKISGLIISVVLALSLTSCAKENSVSAKENGGLNGETESGEIQGEVGSEQPKANYLIDKIFDTDEYLPEYDADNNSMHLYPGVLETTDDALYFMYDDNVTYNIVNRNVLCFYDKASGISGPLCSNPDCDHLNDDCPARFSYSATVIGDYDNSLYVYSQDAYSVGSTIYKMNYSNQLMTKANEIKQDFEMDAADPAYIFHRGYLYIASRENVISNGEVKTSMMIRAVPINGNSDGFEIVFNREYNTLYHYNLRFYANDLYIMIDTPDQLSEEEIPTKSGLEIYRFDLKTRETETVFKDIVDFSPWEIWKKDGDIYLSEAGEHGIGVYVIKSGSNSIEHLFDFSESVRNMGFLFDGKAAAFGINDGAFTTEVRDFDGNIIGSGSSVVEGLNEKFEYAYTVLSADDNYIYWSAEGRQKTPNKDGTRGSSLCIIATPFDCSSAKVIFNSETDI